MESSSPRRDGVIQKRAELCATALLVGLVVPFLICAFVIPSPSWSDFFGVLGIGGLFFSVVSLWALWWPV